MTLQGKKALVTGGTRGIGAAVALRLIELGADVTVTGTGKGPSIEPPPGAAIELVDFSDRAATESFAVRLEQRHFDILVNSAGINAVSPFTEIKLEDFDRIHEVNLRAPLLLCRATVPSMVSRGWGRIVNITSVFSQVTREQRASYSASKSGLVGMSKAIAVEVASRGVLVNCVAPGFIDTELTRRVLGEKGMEELAKQVPARRMGQPGEVAKYVAWLVGPENTFITGQNLFVDGGFTCV